MAQSSAELREYESMLVQQLNSISLELQHLDADIEDSTQENEQLISTVESLRDMRYQMERELEALVPLSTESIENAKYESNEIRKTLLENELFQSEETLKNMAFRIQELIKQRMDRDAEADNFARRVLAMQKLINRPRGVGTTSSAVRELKHLEQENRNLQDEIAALRASVGSDANDIAATAEYDDPSLPENSPKRRELRKQAEKAKERYIQEKLEEAGAKLVEVEEEERHLQQSFETRVDKAKRELAAEYKEKVRQLTARFESSRTAALLSTKSKTEAAVMTPKELLKRAMEQTKRSLASGGKGDGVEVVPQQSTTDLTFNLEGNAAAYISHMASERAKTTVVARSVADQVKKYQVLNDENSALQALLAKMVAQHRETNDNVREMAQQLEALQLRLKDECRNRDLWIEHDAQQLNESLVSSIIAKDSELKALQAEIEMWQQHAHTLQQVSPSVRHLTMSSASSPMTAQSPLSHSADHKSHSAVNPSSPFTSATPYSGLRSTPSGGQFGITPRRTGGINHGGNDVSELKQSMLLDL